MNFPLFSMLGKWQDPNGIGDHIKKCFPVNIYHILQDFLKQKYDTNYKINSGR